RLPLAVGAAAQGAYRSRGRCSYPDSRTPVPAHGRSRQPLSLAYRARSSSSHTASTMVKPNRRGDTRSKWASPGRLGWQPVGAGERVVHGLGPVADDLVAAFGIVGEHVGQAES